MDKPEPILNQAKLDKLKAELSGADLFGADMFKAKWFELPEVKLVDRLKAKAQELDRKICLMNKPKTK